MSPPEARGVIENFHIDLNAFMQGYEGFRSPCNTWVVVCCVPVLFPNVHSKPSELFLYLLGLVASRRGASLTYLLIDRHKRWRVHATRNTLAPTSSNNLPTCGRS